MDGVELAAGRADTAADADLVVDTSRAAGEAAGRFGLDLLFGERETFVGEGLDLLGLFARDLTDCMVVAVDDEVVLVDHVEVVSLHPADGEAVAPDIAVDRVGTFLTGGNGADGEVRTGVDVAADKDVGFSGLVGPLVGLGRAVAVGLDLGAVEEAAPLDGLADGGEDIVRVEGHGVVLIVLRAEAVVCVKHGDTLLEHDRFDFAVLDDEFLRTPAALDDDVLFFCFEDFIVRGGHLIALFEAEHGDLVSTVAGCGTGDVDCDITATDDDHVAGEFRDALERDISQEVDTGQDAFRVFALDTELASALGADGHIEALVAFVTQLLDSDVFADFDAALDVDAELPDDVDLRVDDVLLEAEVRHTEDHHAAGDRFLLEDGDVVAEDCQVVSGGQAGGAGTDDGDFMAAVVELLGDPGVVLGLDLEFGDVALDFVDRHRGIDVAARTDLFAEAGTDASADGRERVLFLDELEGFLVAAFGGHAQVALDGDVRRAVGLTRSRAGLGNDMVSVGVELVTFPVLREHDDLVVGGDVLFDLDRCLLAELLTELDRVLRADFDAAAAGDAVVRVDMGSVVRRGHVRGGGVPGGLQRHAGLPVTVTDEEAFVRAVHVGQLMDAAVVFGFLDDGFRFGAVDAPCLAGADEVVCILTEGDAVLVKQVIGAFFHHFAETAALAVRHSEVSLVAVEPPGDLLAVRSVFVPFDGTLDGDGAHNGGTHRSEAGDELLQVQDVVDEARCRFRVLRRELTGHGDVLHGARREDGQQEHVDALVVRGVLDDADLRHFRSEFGAGFDAHALDFCQLLDVVRLAQLHLQDEVDHLVGQHAVPEHILPGVLRGERVQEVDMRDHLQQVLPDRLVRGFLVVLLQTLQIAMVQIRRKSL